MTSIVGLVGYSKTGKDTLAGMLTEYRRIAFADALKHEVTKMLAAVGVNVDIWGEDKEQYRDLLIYWGRKRREQDPNYWLKKVVFEILRNPDERFIVTDVRYPNEARWILEHEGEILNIERPGYKPVSEEEAITITQIRKLYPAPIIVNDGTPKDLEKMFRDMLRNFRSHKGISVLY